jgi:hypothetical protein
MCCYLEVFQSEIESCRQKTALLTRATAIVSVLDASLAACIEKMAWQLELAVVPGAAPFRFRQLNTQLMRLEEAVSFFICC